MKGFQVTFFTQHDHRHHDKPIANWLVHLAKEMKLPGATMIAGSEGFGQHRRMHLAHFFRSSEQPLEVQIALTEEQFNRLFDRLKAEGVKLFYVKSPVEFGSLGGDAK